MRVALIGYGSIGQRHARNIEALGHEVVIYDPPKGYTNAPTLPIDAIVHATPVSERRVLDDSVYPHFVEKPVALRASDVPHVRSLVQVGYNLRFDASLRAWKKSLPANIVSAKVWQSQRLDEWQPGRDYRATPYAATGILLESHELDLVRWLFGAWDSVVAKVRRASDLDIAVEDSVAAIVTTTDGVVVQLSLDMVGSGYRRGVEVTTAGGTVLEWTPDWSSEEKRNAMYLAEMRGFLESVRSGALDPDAATLEDGIASLRLAEAIRRASDTNEMQWNGAEVEGDLFSLSRLGW